VFWLCPPDRLPPLVLASSSPRRRELLTRIGLDFRVQTLAVDEAAHPRDCPEGTVRRLAREKGVAVALSCPGELTISADTVVALDGELLGKPETAAQAEEMLARLSGRWHEVWTGYALHWVQPDGSLACDLQACRSRVRFHELEAGQIRAYVASGEPMDKAGAYGIQDLGALLVAEIEGDYFNVMGLPVAHLARRLVRFAKPPGES
jgi:septum formation protein